MNRYAAALCRLAVTLPSGSPDRRVILALLKEAAAREDFLARYEFLGGLTGKPSNRVKSDLKQGDYEPYVEALVANGWKGGTAARPGEAMTFVDPTANLGLWTAVVRGGNSALGRSVNEVAKWQPALSGLSGEDVAQVLSFGGQHWPGMRFDSRVTNETGGHGDYVERKPGEEPYQSGDNIYRAAGAAMKGKRSNLPFLIKKLHGGARNKAKDWLRSVDAGKWEGPFPQNEEGQEIVPRGYAPPDPADMLTKELYLKAINPVMVRVLEDAPAQARIWEALLASVKAHKNFLGVSARGKGEGDVTLAGTKFRSFMEDHFAGQEDEEGNPIRIPTTQKLAATFQKILKKMRAALGSLSDEQLAKGLPKQDREILKDRDLASVYWSEVHRRRRALLIRLASAFPTGSQHRRELLRQAVATNEEEEESAQAGRVRKQDQPKNLKQRLNPTPLSPPKVGAEGRQAKEKLTEKALVKYLEATGDTVSAATLAYGFGGSSQQHTKFLQRLVADGILNKKGREYGLAH